jgi:mannose-6-phosphate isomerase-like protein (cupin superfamily)
MIFKFLADHVVKTSPTCGAIHEVLRGAEYSPNVAIAFDISATIPHYHKTFDEIYFVIDGQIDLRLHNPATGQTTVHHLEANELCVITKGIHHEIMAASSRNRLAVMTVPRFDISDEHLSDVLK